MSVLALRNIHVSPWGTRLLENINFELEAGNILGIIGEHALDDWPRLELACHMAYLPQLSLLNFPYTVEEVILLGRNPHSTGRRIDREVLQEVAQLTDVIHLLKRLYTRLSGGEKQRVQLARIFCQIWRHDTLEGTLLLLDEPTAALDIKHQQSTSLAIKSLADKGCAVVLVNHDFNAIAGIADQVIALKNGMQFFHGTPREVFTEHLFQEVFGTRVIVEQHPQRNQPMIIPA